jgi:hypothetical protein
VIGLATIDRSFSCRKLSAIGSETLRQASSSSRAARPVRHTIAGARKSWSSDRVPTGNWIGSSLADLADTGFGQARREVTARKAAGHARCPAHGLHDHPVQVAGEEENDR